MYIKVLGIVVSAFLIAACQPNVLDQCWSVETKQKSAEVAKRIVLGYMVSEAKATWPAGKEFSESDEKAISKIVSVSLSDFHLVSKDKASESFRCGANAKAEVNVGPGKSVGSETQIIEFNINPGEQGYVITMSPDGGLLSLEQSLVSAITSQQ